MPLRHISTAPSREAPHTPDSRKERHSALIPHEEACSDPSFANFISNSKHRLILAVLQELAEGQTATVTSVLLDGPSGTGKTHLLRASARDMGLTIPPHYLETPDSLASLLDQHQTAARETLLARPSLIIDDMHLPIPQVVQLQLCSILDRFTDARKPILLAGTGTFATWPMEAALRSRLKAGLILSLPETDLDLRLRFILQRAETLCLPLSRELTLTMARQCTDLRELTGLMRRMAFCRRLNGTGPDEREIDALLSGARPEGVLTPQTIISEVSRQLGVNQKDLLGSSRTPSLVFARQLSMYLCRSLLGLSYPALGRIFGGKNHSSVMHAVKKIKQSITDNKVTHNLVTELTKQCQKGTY